jgi:uncharacterized membrane protein YeaQ/YmgE (transglycosylase-associated protein family)
MDTTQLIVLLVIGAIAGWLAGSIMKGGKLGLLGNVVIGVIGSFIGGSVFRFLGIPAASLMGSIVTATTGAVLLLYIMKLIKKS